MQRFESVAHSGDVAYVLSKDWTLVRTNDGWKQFALENGGDELLERWPEGSNIESVIPPGLASFYHSAFAAVHATGQHWEHDFECSSAELYRGMHMVVYPLETGYVLVVNSVLVQRAHTHEVVPASAYERRGVISTCCHCRRFRSLDREGTWDWVPDFIRQPPRNLSHGLCPSCLAFYYP